jgi:hypothetical protein
MALVVCAAGAFAIAVLVLPRCAERAVPAAAQTRLERSDGDGAARSPRAPVLARAEAHDAGAGHAPLATELPSEQALMDEAERVLLRNPEQTLVLIEAADRRFGSAMESRRKLEIEALVRLSRIGLAHSKADRFYRAFPSSPAIREIERRTGYHPRPTGPTE